MLNIFNSNIVFFKGCVLFIYYVVGSNFFVML